MRILTAPENFLPWRVRGPYLESCNCDPVCPCRTIGGRSGGRSTHGYCLGALSWSIDDGRAGETALSGLAAVLAYQYDDDVAGSPWLLRLYVDERGDASQRAALEGIFLGRLGSGRLLAEPWVRKPSKLVDVRPARIEIGPTTISVGDAISVRAGERVETDETVTCIVPGHDREGRERHGELLRAEDPPFEWEWTAVCAFESTFDYSSAD